MWLLLCVSKVTLGLYLRVGTDLWKPTMQLDDWNFQPHSQPLRGRKAGGWINHQWPMGQSITSLIKNKSRGFEIFLVGEQGLYETGELGEGMESPYPFSILVLCLSLPSGNSRVINPFTTKLVILSQWVSWVLWATLTNLSDSKRRPQGPLIDSQSVRNTVDNLGFWLTSEVLNGAFL